MTDPADPFSTDGEASEPDPRVLRRLMAKVETLPFRYAPFFDRLAELFDLSERDIEALLESARDERSWQRTWLPGVRRFEVRPGPRLRGAEACLMRFSPGLEFPKHRHLGPETLFVLEGNYVDTSGTRVGAGDEQDMQSGSEHTLRVEEHGPCVLAVVSGGVEFTGPVLGRLAGLLEWFRR
jgi:quercetin dioxygenase-like cupin family protein